MKLLGDIRYRICADACRPMHVTLPLRRSTHATVEYRTNSIQLRNNGDIPRTFSRSQPGTEEEEFFRMIQGMTVLLLKSSCDSFQLTRRPNLLSMGWQWESGTVF